MQLVTFILLNNERDALEYKLNYNKKLYNLNNLSAHAEGIYKFRTPSQEQKEIGLLLAIVEIKELPSKE